MTGFFSVCADFGLYSFTIKEISRHKNSFQSYFQRIYSLRLIQFIVLLTLLLVIIPFLTFSTETKLIIAIIGIYQITYSFIDGLSAVFIAHEYMGTSAIIEASTRIITSLIAISIALLGGNIIVSLIIFPIFSVVQLLIVKKLLMKKFGKVKTLFSFNSLIGTFKQALPFGTSDFLSQLYERIDIVLIGFLLGESAAGLYNVGYRIVFFLVFIPKFASITLFPIVSRLFHDSFFEFQKMFDKSLSMIMIIGLPISAGLWLIAPQFIELIFGPKFIESSVVLKILSGLFLLNCLGNIMGTFLMASDQQTARAKIIWLITCVSILLNLIFFLLL